MSGGSGERSSVLATLSALSACIDNTEAVDEPGSMETPELWNEFDRAPPCAPS